MLKKIVDFHYFLKDKKQLSGINPRSLHTAKSILSSSKVQNVHDVIKSLYHHYIPGYNVIRLYGDYLAELEPQEKTIGTTEMRQGNDEYEKKKID